MVPVRVGDERRLALFDQFFAQTDVEKAPVDDRRIQSRDRHCARHGFKTFDAINLAAAVEYGCHRFLTNDAKLARFPDIAVEILP